MSSPGTTERILIVGGGYAGLSAAGRLAQCGLPITLFEAARLGFEASTRNQGWLQSGGVFARDNPELARMCYQSLQQTVQFCPDCLEPGHDGMAYLISSPDTLHHAWTEAWQAAGIPFEEWTPQQLADRLGRIQRSRVQRAFLLPDRSIRPDVLLDRLAAMAQNSGAEIRTQAPIARLLRAGDAVIGVATADGEEVYGRLVILATGADGASFWSQILPSEPGCQSLHVLIGLKTHLVAVQPEIGLLPFCVLDRGGFNHLPHAPRSVFGSNRWTVTSIPNDRTVEAAEINCIWQQIHDFFPDLDRTRHQVAAWAGTTVQAMHCEQVEPGRAPLPTVIDHAQQSPPLHNLLSIFPGRATLWAALAELTRTAVQAKLGTHLHAAVAPPWCCS